MWNTWSQPGCHSKSFSIIEKTVSTQIVQYQDFSFTPQELTLDPWLFCLKQKDPPRFSRVRPFRFIHDNVSIWNSTPFCCDSGQYPALLRDIQTRSPVTAPLPVLGRFCISLKLFDMDAELSVAVLSNYLFCIRHTTITLCDRNLSRGISRSIFVSSHKQPPVWSVWWCSHPYQPEGPVRSQISSHRPSSL